MTLITAAVLADNHALKAPFMAEHGFSVLLQTASRVTLFDTGCSNLFERNAARMHFELYDIGAIAVSHGHYDHTSGLPQALLAAPASQLYLHPAALFPKYHHDDNGKMRAIGIPEASLHAVKQAEADHRLRLVDTPTAALDDHTLLFLSEGRSFLPPDWRFYTGDATGAVAADRFDGELSLLHIGDHGSLLVVGCAHTGIAALIAAAERLSPQPLRTVLGGSHIDHAPDAELDDLATFLAARPDLDLYLGHCTGIDGFSRLYCRLPNRLHPLAAGMVLEFDL